MIVNANNLNKGLANWHQLLATHVSFLQIGWSQITDVMIDSKDIRIAATATAAVVPNHHHCES